MKVRVGEWTVDPSANVLTREGEEVRVEQRVMRVLMILVEANGDVVSKESMIDSVWKGAAVSDHSVAHTISTLRRIMGDDRKNPRYIETISKRGYRLIETTEPVEPLESPSTETTSVPWTVLVNAAAIFLIATLVIWSFIPDVAPSRRLVLTDIQNATGSTAWDLPSRATTDLLTTVLAGGDYRLTRWRGRADREDLGVALADLSGERLQHDDLILEGRVTLDGIDAVLVLELSAWGDQAVVWARSFPFEGQGLAELSKSVGPYLSREAGLRVPGSGLARLDPQLAEDYWRARHLWALREEIPVREALALLLRIVDQAPEFAEAHAALADIYAQKTAEELGLDRATTFDISETHLATAIRLDPTLGEAYITQAFLVFYRDGDMARALDHVQTAIDLLPQNALAWETRAMIESAMGRIDDSLASIERARALDPLSASVMRDRMWFLYLADRPHDAREASTLLQQFAAPWSLADCLIFLALGDYEAAFDALYSRSRARGYLTADNDIFLGMRRTHGSEAALAALALATSQDGTPWLATVPRAIILSSLGDEEGAIAELNNRAQDESAWWWRWAPMIPEFRSFKDDPRLAHLSSEQE